MHDNSGGIAAMLGLLSSAFIMLECRCWIPLSRWPNTTKEHIGFVGWNHIVWQNPWRLPWAMVDLPSFVAYWYKFTGPAYPSVDNSRFDRFDLYFSAYLYHLVPPLSFDAHIAPGPSRSSRVRCTWFAKRSRALVVVFWLLASACHNECPELKLTLGQGSPAWIAPQIQDIYI